MNKIGKLSLWKPAACVFVVLLQWAVWSHLGLEITPASNEPAEKMMQDLGQTDGDHSDQEAFSHHETTAGTGWEFEIKGKNKKRRSLPPEDLCWQLKDWPLPGCRLG